MTGDSALAGGSVTPAPVAGFKTNMIGAQKSEEHIINMSKSAIKAEEEDDDEDLFGGGDEDDEDYQQPAPERELTASKTTVKQEPNENDCTATLVDSAVTMTSSSSLAAEHSSSDSAAPQTAAESADSQCKPTEQRTTQRDSNFTPLPSSMQPFPPSLPPDSVSRGDAPTVQSLTAPTDTNATVSAKDLTIKSETSDSTAPIPRKADRSNSLRATMLIDPNPFQEPSSSSLLLSSLSSLSSLPSSLHQPPSSPSITAGIAPTATNTTTLLTFSPNSSGPFGLPSGVRVPASVTAELLNQGRLLETIQALPVNLINDALTEYDDAVQIKGGSIRNQGAYLFGVVKRYVSVHERAASGEGSGILPMGEGLTDLVHTRLEQLVTSGFCTREEMNEKVRSKIRMLSEKDALFALDELASVERSSIRNFGSYFMGILNRYMRGDARSKIRPAASGTGGGGPSTAGAIPSPTSKIGDRLHRGGGGHPPLGVTGDPSHSQQRGRDRFSRDPPVQQHPMNASSSLSSNSHQHHQPTSSSFLHARDRSRDRFDDRRNEAYLRESERRPPSYDNRPGAVPLWQQQQQQQLQPNHHPIPPPPPPLASNINNSNNMRFKMGPGNDMSHGGGGNDMSRPNPMNMVAAPGMGNYPGQQPFVQPQQPSVFQQTQNQQQQQQQQPYMAQMFSQNYGSNQNPQQQQTAIPNSVNPMSMYSQQPPQAQNLNAMRGQQQQQPPFQVGNQQLSPHMQQQQQQQPPPLNQQQHFSLQHQQQQPSNNMALSYGNPNGGAPWQQQQQQTQSQIPVDILGLADKAASAVQALANQSKVAMTPYGVSAATGLSVPTSHPSFPTYGGNAAAHNPHVAHPSHAMGAGPMSIQHPHQQQQQLNPVPPLSSAYSSQQQQQQQQPRNRRTTASIVELPVSVQFAVQNLQSTGTIQGPLDDGMLGMIFDLPEHMALTALQKFASIDKNTMRNRTAYLAGVLRRELEKIHKR